MTEDEYHLDNETVRSFIETVRRTADEHEEVPALLAELHDPFRELLLDDEWLPELYRNLPPEDFDDKGEMGGDIAQWLLYRLPEKLALFTLVVPPGSRTPVHDHLVWGLVGLCQGTQEERFYRRVDDEGNDYGHAELELDRTVEAGRGDFYELIPPEDDIHSVHTTSEVPSVSLHLLGADVGCIKRHAFDTEYDYVKPFQSHYTNVRCEVPEAAADGAGHGHHHHHHHGHHHPHDHSSPELERHEE